MMGKELREALDKLPSPIVTIAPDSVWCVCGSRLHSIRLSVTLAIEPVTIPKPTFQLPDGEIELFTDCGIVLLNGEPLFAEPTPVLNHPEFDGPPARLSERDYHTVAPFATWEGSTYQKAPFWYIRSKGGLLHATDCRALIELPAKLPDCYIWPQETEGGLEVWVSGEWVKQRSGRYTVIHRYDSHPWPKLPALDDIPPDRVVDKLPEGIRIQPHEERRVLAALHGQKFAIELRRDRPILYRSERLTIIHALTKEV